MSFKQKLTLAAVSFLIPMTTVAATVPGNVKTVQASLQNGVVTASWSDVSGATGYHVYYSHESILGNGGNYDDFVAVNGPVTTYTFPTVPVQSSTMFIAILAVDAAGTESDGFEVETSVTLPTTASSSVSSIPSSPSVSSAASSVGSPEVTTATPMAVATVRSVSETGVLVTFTKDVKSDAGLGLASFLITTDSGTLLTIVKVDVNGKETLLSTDKQKADEHYVLSLLSVIPATDGTNATPNEPEVRFDSFIMTSAQSSMSSSYGRNPQLSSSSSSQQIFPPQNPSFLNLTALPLADGKYNVLAEWGMAPGADSFSLYTSKDNAAYLASSTVGAERTKVQYNHLDPGIFGVKVAAKNAGGESAGIEKVINLPASGVGLLGIAAAAGALTSRRMKRRKSVVR